MKHQRRRQRRAFQQVVRAWNAISAVAFLAVPAWAAEEDTQLPETVVTGQQDKDSYQPQAASSPKYTGPLRNVPQTVLVIPRSVMRDVGATTMRDILQNTPGITFQAGEGGVTPGDNFTLRGFSATNDLFVDGVRDLSPTTRDEFNLEQVEIAKGPGSVYSGRGSTGGSINLVTKSPQLDRAYSGTVGLGSDDHKRATIDVNQPFEVPGIEGAALRFNAMGQDSDTPGRHGVFTSKWGYAPSLVLGLGTPTRLTLTYYHEDQDNMPDYGLPWIGNDTPPQEIRHNFYGLTYRDFEYIDTHAAGARFEYDINERLSLRSQLRYQGTESDRLLTSGITPATGARNTRSHITDDEALTLQNDVTSKFETFGVGHTLVTGMDVSREASVYNTYPSFPAAPNTGLHQPNPDDPPGGGTLESGPREIYGTAYPVGVYAFDTLALSGQWDLTGGLRWDRYEVDLTQSSGATYFSIDNMLSWRSGLVFKPTSFGSIYAAYGTSFNPSVEGLGRESASLDSAAPEESRTAEVGTKWDLFGTRLSLTAALFTTEKTNTRITVSTSPTVTELAGESRVRGLELGAAGRVTDDWQVFSGYTLLDGRIIEGGKPSAALPEGANDGNVLPNTPKHAFTFWTTYQLPWKVQVGGGAQYMDKAYANVDNQRHVGDYWLLNAMTAYQVTDAVKVQLNLYNLTDEYYFETYSGGRLIPGRDRSAIVTTSFDF